jgi:hypothetical protein
MSFFSSGLSRTRRKTADESRLLFAARLGIIAWCCCCGGGGCGREAPSFTAGDDDATKLLLVEDETKSGEIFVVVAIVVGLRALPRID